MKNIVFIISRSFLPAAGGREVVLYNYCKGIKEDYNCKITLICFNANKEEIKNLSDLDFIENAYSIPLPKKYDKIKNIIFKSLLLRKWPLQVSAYYSNYSFNNIQEIVNKISPDMIICDMCRTAEYGKRLKGNFKKILDMDDLLSNRYKRQCEKVDKSSNILGQYSKNVSKLIKSIISNYIVSKSILYIEAKLLKRYEISLEDYFESIIFVSELETEQYNKVTKSKKAVCIPIGVDYEYYSERVVEKSKYPLIIFLGNMYISHNVAAVNNFINNIYPHIINKNPNIKFRIVGKCSDEYKKNMENSHIEVTGMVDDIRRYVQQGWILVAPLTYGSGVKTKILESMAMGVPVVTNDIGVEGIKCIVNRDIIVENDNYRFAKSVTDILEDIDYRNKLSINTSNFVKNNYTWNKVLLNFNEILK